MRRDPLFDKKDAAGFGLLALVVLLLNLLFWAAMLVGALFILRAFGVVG
jgi:hypothetical protein